MKKVIFPSLFCLAAALPVAAMPGMAKQAGAAPTIKGELLEVLQTDSYTYLKIARGKEKAVWAAVPRVEAVKGKTVEIYAGMEMKDFKSKTLKRTFKSVIFSTGLVGGEGMKARHGAPAAAPGEPVKVDKAKGDGARSVAEVFKERHALAGKTVLVRGKVVRVSKGIMDRNWVHLQDGTGSAKTKDNDLLVTTLEAPGMGEVATFKGEIAVDRDFGAGYSYAVLIEKAVLVN